MLERLSGVLHKPHNLTVTLARWPKYADITSLTVWAAESADDQRGASILADRVLVADINAERLIGRGLKQPRLEVVQKTCDLLNLLALHEFWLIKQI